MDHHDGISGLLTQDTGELAHSLTVSLLPPLSPCSVRTQVRQPSTI